MGAEGAILYRFLLALTDMIPYNHSVHAGIAQLLERFLAKEEARS